MPDLECRQGGCKNQRRMLIYQRPSNHSKRFSAHRRNPLWMTTGAPPIDTATPAARAPTHVASSPYVSVANLSSWVNVWCPPHHIGGPGYNASDSNTNHTLSTLITTRSPAVVTQLAQIYKKLNTRPQSFYYQQAPINSQHSPC